MKSCVHALALSSQVRRSAAIGLATLALLCGSASAISTIEPLHWYRMGDALEIDPSGQPMIDAGTPAPILHDSLNGAELQAIGTAGTIANQTYVREYDTGLLTQRSLTVPAGSSGYIGELLSGGTDDFEFEGWLTVPNGKVTRNMCLACNGTPGVDGWSIYLETASIGPGSLVIRYGPTIVVTYALADNIPLSQPTYFCLAHSSALGERINLGAGTYTLKNVPLTAPTGHFTLGAAPDGGGGYKDFYTGTLDEIRFSRLQLDLSDPRLSLLSHAPDVSLLISTSGIGSTTLSHSSEVDLGTVGTGGSKYIFNSVQPVVTGVLENGIVVYGMTVDGPDAADFQLVPQQSFPETYGYAYAALYFRPTTPGPKTATLTIVSNDPDDSRLKITFHATAVAAPDIAVYTGSDPAKGAAVTAGVSQVIFPAFPGGLGGETYFSIRNTGLRDLHLSQATLIGNDPGSFLISQQPSATVAPGGTTVLGIRFRPSAGGARQAIVLLPSDAANDSLFHLPVSAAASGPSLQLNGPDGSLLASRAVMGWGNNTYTQNNVPAGLAAVKGIVSGADFDAILRLDGTVAVWGALYDELNIPAGLSGVTQLAAGSSDLLALRSDGTVVAWGYQNDILNVPAGLTGVTALAGGSNFALALKGDGTLTGWGSSGTAGLAVPADLAGVIAISASQDHAIALKGDGTVVDWGSSSIAPPAGLNQVVAIEATTSGGLALKTDGSIISWTNKAAGSPFQDNGSPIAMLGGGDKLSTAIRADGTVALAGGTNTYGELVEPRFPHRAIAIWNNGGHVLELYDSRVDLSAADPRHTGIPQTFTITNSGTTGLQLMGAGLSGNSADYLVDSSEMASVLAPGETTTFTVALAAGAAGNEEAILEIASDDPGHPAFTVRVAGQPQMISGPYDTWKSQYFPSGGANASDLADPNGNGIPNLLEYALGGNPLATAAANVLPPYSMDSSGSFSFGVKRYPLRTDVVTTLQGSDTLNDGDWVDLASSTGGSSFQILATGLSYSITATSESGVYLYNFKPSATAALTAPHRYLRVKVSTR